MQYFEFHIQPELLTIRCLEDLIGGATSALKEMLDRELKQSLRDVQIDFQGTYRVDHGFLRWVTPVGVALREAGRKLCFLNPSLALKKMIKSEGLESVVHLVLQGEKPDTECAPVVDVAFMNAFVDAVTGVAGSHFGLEFQPGKPVLTRSSLLPKLTIGGEIKLQSLSVEGSIQLLFEEALFLSLMSKLLGEKIEKADEVLDGASEFLNMVFGQAKTALNSAEYGIVPAIPRVLTAEDLIVRSKGPCPVLCVPFSSQAGSISFEIKLSRRDYVSK